MLDLTKSRAIVTGASRGIGVFIAEALAERGCDLVLAARNGKELDEVRARVARHGKKVVAVPTDVSDRAALEALAARATAELGEVDLLVNNAGVEHVAYYEDLTLDEIDQFVDVNLRAPLQLTRLVLPGMIARNRGHVVHVASLAGLGPAAFSEPYGATKAGLVGFSRSLRASLQSRGSQVSTSVVCPGFISDAGMFEENRRRFGAKAPASLGTSTPAAVAAAVVRAIDDDLGEVIVNKMPIRPLLAVGMASPRLAEWLVRVLKANATFQAIADKRRSA